MRATALALMLLAGPAFSQTGPLLSITDFSDGLNTYQSPLFLKDSEAQVARNVVLDKNGTVSSREGYTKINATAIGGGSSDVNAVYNFETSNGNRYCVAFSSTNGVSSTDGCQTFTIFVTTLTRNNDVNCDALQDRLYCVNNNFNFYFDGTNDVPNPNAPSNLQYIRVHHNYCFAAGASGAPYRLYFSALGDCSTWTTASDFVDLNNLAGDVITGIGKPIYDMLPIYMKFSTWALKGYDRNSFVLINISPTIGAKNHRSIDNHYYNGKNGVGVIQLFDSVGPSGGQPGIYGFDGRQVFEISKKLRNDLDKIDTFKQVTNRKIIDSYADWSAGTYNTLAMSPNRDFGFMQSSYTTYTDTLGDDFGQGTLTGVTTSFTLNAVRVSSSPFLITNGGFETGSTSRWTITTSGSTCEANAQAAVSGSYGFQATNQSCLGGQDAIVRVLNANDVILASSSYVAGQNVISGSFNLTNYSSQTLKIEFEAYGGAGSGAQCIAKSSTFTALSRVEWSGRGGGCATSQWAALDDIKVDRYFDISMTSHVYTQKSKIFDMAISTPVGSNMTFSTGTAFTNATIAMQVRSSTASDGGGFGDWSAVASTYNTRIALTQRYWQYQSSFTLTTSTDVNPQLSDVSFAAASTGTWRSNELFLSNDILAAGFGLFQTNQAVTGNAAIAYNVRISSYLGGTAYALPVAITAGNAITNSTGAYCVIEATFTVTSGTETARVDNITLSWNEGARAVSPSAAVFQGRYHYGAQSLNSGDGINDAIYVLDSNLAWTRWDGVVPRYLGVVNQQFMMADSTTTSGGSIYQLYSGNTDNGKAINTVYQTKDFPLGDIAHVKSVEKVYMMNKADNTTLTVGLIGNTGLLSSSFSVDLSTGMSYGIKQLQVEPPKNANVFSLKFSNSLISQPWELNAYGMSYRDMGLEQP